MTCGRFSIRKKIMFLLFGILFATLLTGAVMFLWNWLLPPIFGLAEISFWQALGLLVLSKILFGGGPPWKRGYSGHGGWRYKRKWMERWKNMSEEERAKFKESMRHKPWTGTADQEPPKES